MNFFSGYNYQTGGSVAPGFEPVREAFEQNFLNGLESRAQLCVYVGEEKVIGILLEVSLDIIN